MPLNNYQTLDDVLRAMDSIIEESIREKNYLGLFAYVYRRTTARIKKEIEEGNFEDNARLEKLDIVFAGLYLDAYHRYRENKSIHKSWKIAFDAKNQKLAVIQHILLGMNAHINVDLAVSASTIMEGKPMGDLENDFNKVNDILASLLNEMQDRIGKVSVLMVLLDWLGKRTDEKIIDFSMVQARKQSWRIANELWKLKGDRKNDRINEVDHSVSKIADFIKSPKSGLIAWILKLIGLFETRNITKLMEGISGNS